MPCENQDECWTLAQKHTYAELLRRADEVEYISPAYTATCMHKRNRALIDRSSACICYLRRSGSGTGYTVRYAQEQKKEMILL